MKMDMSNCLMKRKLKTENDDKKIDKMKMACLNYFYFKFQYFFVVACLIVVTGDFCSWSNF